MGLITWHVYTQYFAKERVEGDGVEGKIIFHLAYLNLLKCISSTRNGIGEKTNELNNKRMILLSIQCFLVKKIQKWRKHFQQNIQRKEKSE